MKSITRNATKKSSSRWKLAGSVESGWKCFCTKYQITPTTNITSMKGETSGSRIWKIRMLGSATNPKAPLRAKTPLMLEDGLQNSKRPAETLAHERVGAGGSFGEGQRQVFVFHAIAVAQQRHGEIGVFGDGIDVIAAGLADRLDAPGADGSGHHAHRAHGVQRAAFEILAGDVFERLPARPEIHAVADFGVAGHGCNFRIEEVRHHAQRWHRER